MFHDGKNPPNDPPARDVLHSLDANFSGACSYERGLLSDIVDCDRRGLWEGDGHSSMAGWLSARFGYSNWKSRRMIEAAYKLEKLPRLAAALSSGALCLDKTLELARFATPENEKKLLSWALRVSTAAIRRRADREMKAAEEVAAEAQADRYFRSWLSLEGEHIDFEGRLPLAEGTKLIKHVERLAKQLPEEPVSEKGAAPDGVTAFEMKKADALSLMAAAGIANDQDPDLATVTLTVPFEALEKGSYGAQLESGANLHPKVAERLLCSCRLQPIAIGRDGEVGVGRVFRNVPHWLRRKVMQRDGGRCVFPGCERTSFLTPHHANHWTRGGETDEDNLGMLCSAHHQLVHEGGWSVVFANDGTPTFFRPSGRIYDPHPGAIEDLEAESEREIVRRRSRNVTELEERYGIENYRLKETGNGFADDLFELARHLAEV